MIRQRQCMFNRRSQLVGKDKKISLEVAMYAHLVTIATRMDIWRGTALGRSSETEPDKKLNESQKDHSSLSTGEGGGASLG